VSYYLGFVHSVMSCASWRGNVGIGAVVDDADFFEGNEAAFHHFIEDGKESVEFFFGVHDFDHERKVHGEAKDLGGMEAAGFTEAHGTAQDCRAGEV